MNCATCRFMDLAVGEDDEPRMECHRYPPVLIGFLGDEAVQTYPTVYDASWCGEWAGKEVK